MKLNKLLPVALLTLILCVSSCKKFLDTAPEDFISPVNYYKTETDLNKALAGVYDRLGDTRTYARGLYTYLVFSDEYFIKGQTTGYLANSIDASTLEINRCWESIYAGIERANMLLDNIGNASVSENFRNEIKGQTLFMRAYYYFLLTDMFGDVPLKLKSTSSPTEPSLTRTPVREVYEQIIKDMKEAEGLVKKISDYGFSGRITRTVVQGMLARVYLTMAGQPLNDNAKYTDARAYADSVIKSGEHALNPDYAQIYINHAQDLYDIKESMWEVEFNGNNSTTVTEGGSVGAYIGIACTDVTVGYGYDYVHTTARLYNGYEANDLRRDWCIAPFRYVTTGTTTAKTNWTATQIYERSPGKWRREYELLLPRAKDFTPTNFPLLRYADVLLMFAEADNQVNGAPSAAAYDAINQVRRRGFGKPVNTPDAAIDLAPGMNQANFFEAVKKERFRELAFEGLRKHDLIRWGVYVTVMQDLFNEINAGAPAALKAAAISPSKNVTERNILFPIPNSEISVNPYVTQNPGW